MPSNNLLIVGAGGHAKVVYDTARLKWSSLSITFFDELAKAGTELWGKSVHNSLEQLTPSSFIVAIGDNKTRLRLFERLLAKGFAPATVLHPSAIISEMASVGQGTYVGPLAVVNADAQVGDNCIINSGAIVEHDCIVQSHSHISVGVHLGGKTKIQEGCLFGISASSLPSVQIGKWSVVGAGAVVTRDVADYSTVIGVPAKPIGDKKVEV